jgi:hypothetical protein
MSRWIALGRVVAIMVLALAASACTGQAASPAPTVEGSIGPRTLAPATQDPGSGGTPDLTDGSFADPPSASLAAEGGDPVAGSLGSFTWGDGGSDSPWLPGSPVAAASGEPLSVSLANGVPVDGWTVKRVPAGTSDGVGAATIADGDATPVAFPAPGPGTWSVQVVVIFGDDLGSAAYYWQVAVR